MPVYSSGGQLYTAGGSPTGLASPSVALADYGTANGIPMLDDGTLVSFERLYRSQWEVAACCNLITRQVSRLPLKAYIRRGDGTRERLRTGNLAGILRRPWDLGSPSDLKQALMLPTLVNGGGLLAKARDTRFGPVTGLVPVRWSACRVIRDAGGPVQQWQVDQPGLPRYLDPRDVIHVGFRGLDGPIGVSPLEQLGTTIAIEDAAQRHQAASLRNGARPPSAVTIHEKVLEYVPDAAQQQAIVDQARVDLTQIHGGPENAGRPAVLPPGFDWKQVGHTAVEAELIQQRKLTREEVAAVYHIPPPLLGILEYATLANMEEAHRMLFTTVLAPWLTMVEEAIGAQLIAEEATIRGDVFVEFDLNDVLRGDLLKRAQALAQQIAAGILTIDEARELENRPRFDLPMTGAPMYQSNNLTPIGQGMPPAPPANGVTPGFDEPPTDAAIEEAARALASMHHEEACRLLRGNPSVADAILGHARHLTSMHAKGLL